MNRYCVWIIMLAVWIGNVGFSSGAVQVYSKAVGFARTGHEDFAFMHYSSLLRDYPESKYCEDALFAVGEYYFRVSGFQEAEAVFKTFLDDYPDSGRRIYALAYLLNIAGRNHEMASIQGLEKQVIDVQRVSFVFREKKEITYRSPLYQNYRAVIHIDKIEFYVEGKLFAKVSY